MADVMNLFKGIIIVQLFYAVAITLIVTALPASALNHVTMFSDAGEAVDVEGVSSQVQDSLTQQTDIPVIEIGALVFYSGNILIDLLVNFITAIPQMIMLLLNGIAVLFANGLSGAVMASVQLFFTSIVVLMYVIGIIQLLTGIRSGRLV